MWTWIKFLYLRITCIFIGHSHPMLDCFRCGAHSPLEYKMDENGHTILDAKGHAIMVWRGWGWKPDGK